MKGPTVLIVDDEPLILDVWTRILFVAGYDVECAADAHEAFHAFNTARVRVAICYVHLPRARGLRIADMIREQFPATAIILASDEPLVPPPEALRTAVVAYIVPPVSSERLLTIVRTGIAWSLDQTRVH
jgi:DNA-binding NtrC family response regulator